MLIESVQKYIQRKLIVKLFTTDCYKMGWRAAIATCLNRVLSVWIIKYIHMIVMNDNELNSLSFLYVLQKHKEMYYFFCTIYIPVIYVRQGNYFFESFSRVKFFKSESLKKVRKILLISKCAYIYLSHWRYRYQYSSWRLNGWASRMMSNWNTKYSTGIPVGACRQTEN